MNPVNVVVSGLPQCGVLCLKLGDTCRGVTTMEVEHAICSATGMPQDSMFLRAGTRLLLGPTELVCAAGTHTAFVCAGLRRALPGGKGGFGAQLRGASSKSGGPQTTNIDACRDLHGRRIGAVRRERAAAEALAQAQTPVGVEQEPVADRDRIGERFQNLTKHQRKRGRTHSAHQSAPLVAMKEGRTPNGVARYVQEAAADVDDAVRDGLRMNAGYHEDGASHVGGSGSSSGSGSNGCTDGDLDGDIVGGGEGGRGRNSKRRRTSDDSGNGLTLLDAYGSCSSSGDERCADGDDSDGADEHMRDA